VPTRAFHPPAYPASSGFLIVVTFAPGLLGLFLFRGRFELGPDGSMLRQFSFVLAGQGVSAPIHKVIQRYCGYTVTFHSPHSTPLAPYVLRFLPVPPKEQIQGASMNESTRPWIPAMRRFRSHSQSSGRSCRCQLVQHYLGHRNIQYRTRYTELAPDRFEAFGND
jgi:hypothetical protein